MAAEPSHDAPLPDFITSIPWKRLRENLAIQWLAKGIHPDCVTHVREQLAREYQNVASEYNADGTVKPRPLPESILAIADLALRQRAIDSWNCVSRLAGLLYQWRDWVRELPDRVPDSTTFLGEYRFGLSLIFASQTCAECLFGLGLTHTLEAIRYGVLPAGPRNDEMGPEGINSWYGRAWDELPELRRIEDSLNQLLGQLREAPSSVLRDHSEERPALKISPSTCQTSPVAFHEWPIKPGNSVVYPLLKSQWVTGAGNEGFILNYADPPGTEAPAVPNQSLGHDSAVPLVVGYLGLIVNKGTYKVGRQGKSEEQTLGAGLKWYIFMRLYKSGANYCHREEITKAWSDWDTSGDRDPPSPENIDKQISNLRRFLKPLGVEIAGTRLAGWMMVDTSANADCAGE